MQGIYKNIHSKAMPRLRKDFYIMSVQIATWTNKKGFKQDIMLLSGILPHTKSTWKEPQKGKRRCT